MQVSERVLKWAMRLYPPLLLQRIWVQNFVRGFTGVQVKINKSLFNINYNRSIFGGSIFSAADPFYPILFHQVLRKRGYKPLIWVKRSEIDFIKPGNKSLYFRISITEHDVAEACSALDAGNKFVKTYPIEIFDIEGQLCSLVHTEIYIKALQKR